MKYIISEKTRSVFWRQGDEIVSAPIWADNTFTTSEAASIDYLEEVGEWERVTKLLNDR